MITDIITIIDKEELMTFTNLINETCKNIDDDFIVECV